MYVRYKIFFVFGNLLYNICIVVVLLLFIYVFIKIFLFFLIKLIIFCCLEVKLLYDKIKLLEFILFLKVCIIENIVKYSL